LTGEEQGTDEWGSPVVTQTFERVQMIRPAGSSGFDAVRLRPLGRYTWAQVDATAPSTEVQAR
jgi:hypothetical protein